MTRYYPVYLDLRGRLAVVIGGAQVALEKVRGLLDAGARVRVIAREVVPELADLAARGAIEHRARDYREGDLAEAFLALSERLGPAITAAVWREAEKRRIPVNVQDETRHCSFIAAALVRRGDLTLAISTAGKAPALAVRLRQQLERRLGPQYGRFLEVAGRLRAPLAERWPELEERRERWYRLVDSDVLELLRRGDETRARRRIVEIMGVEPAAAVGDDPASDGAAP